MSDTIRHATTEELLALRDGEGAAWTREHAASCEPCTSELFRLEQMRARLRALPAFTPPRDRWQDIARIAKRERRSRWSRGAAGMVAAAALTALTFVALKPSTGSSTAAEQATLDRAMARSQALEQTLKALDPEKQALSGEAARAVAELEDRLTTIDQQLVQPRVWQDGNTRAAELWEQRAGVLGALVDVHTTRAAMAGL
jgi:hypothetical protein